MLITSGNYHFHTREMILEEREQLNARFLVGERTGRIMGSDPAVAGEEARLAACLDKRTTCS
jgi:hypothetical protein